jgi:hypothetical protein
MHPDENATATVISAIKVVYGIGNPSPAAQVEVADAKVSSMGLPQRLLQSIQQFPFNVVKDCRHRKYTSSRNLLSPIILKFCHASMAKLSEFLLLVDRSPLGGFVGIENLSVFKNISSCYHQFTAFSLPCCMQTRSLLLRLNGLAMVGLSRMVNGDGKGCFLAP